MSEPNYIDQKAIYDEQLYCVRQEEMKEIQHRSIGAIQFVNNSKRTGVGSCVMLSKNLLLTSAHNIYDKSYKSEHNSFKIYLGADGVAEHYYTVEEWRFLPEFISCSQNKRTQFDYALVKVKEDPNHPIIYDKFPHLSALCPTCTMNKNQNLALHVFGYPFYRDNYTPLDKHGRRISLNQYGFARQNRMASIQPSQFQIEYAISTYPGQGGCPLIINDGIIGIHLGGSHHKQFNFGRFITSDMIENLLKWSKQMEGGPIIVYKQSCQHNQLSQTMSIAQVQVPEEQEGFLAQILRWIRQFFFEEAILPENYKRMQETPMQINQQNMKNIVLALQAIPNKQQITILTLKQIGTTISIQDCKVINTQQVKVLLSSVIMLIIKKYISEDEGYLLFKQSMQNLSYCKKYEFPINIVYNFHYFSCISGQIQIVKIVIKQQSLCKVIRSFPKLHSLAFCIKFQLFAWKEFHELKKILNEMRLERINIVVDKSFEAFMEKGHWAQEWMKQANAKVSVTHEEWDTMWGWF